jgi:hypothetical protein
MNDPEHRDLLDDAVADVEPRPGLDAIRARTTTGRAGRRPWAWAGAGAVLATAATVAAVTVLSPGPATTPDSDPGFTGRTPAGPSAAPSPTATPDPTPTSDPTGTPAPTTAAAPATGALPVYYVGATSRGPRLFREFAPSRGVGGLVEAVEDAVLGRSADPDYTSGWPAGTFLQHAQLSGGVLAVDLGGPVETRPGAMSAAAARLAVQQLVYTAQAAVQDRIPVTFLVDGRPAARLLGVDTSAPVAEAAQDDVLAQVQVDDPADGLTVGSRFTVRGRAAAFEATVQWELLRDGAEVRKGFTTARECCTLSPFSFDVTGVAPGDYTLVVHDEDASGGEGLPPWQDTKAITVR